MSFSRKYRFHQEAGAAAPHHGGRSGLVADQGRRRPWPSSDVCYGDGGAEACSGVPPPLKRRRPSSSASSAWLQGPSSAGVGRRGGGGFGGDDGGPSTSRNLYCYPKLMIARAEYGVNSYGIPTCKKKFEPVKLAEDEDPVFMSRDEIERSSPSRKDGIDLLRETHLRYSYCAFLQNLGMRLELPQTTIGTAMVLCHRFFVRRSHACHDRFLIATAALFLAAKSEETPRPLNNVVKASTDICYKQNLTSCPYSLPIDWFERYRERVIEAENLILTTLDFELNVQHPYTHLTSVLNKLGLTQTVLVNMAWNLISEGVMSRIICSCSYVVFLRGGLIAVLAENFLLLKLMVFYIYLETFQNPVYRSSMMTSS